MPRRSNDYRTAVWELLKDGQWHSGLELVQVGGMRAGARVHELRRGEDGGPTRRILCRVVDSCSSYRWTCDCGPIPDRPDAGTPFCDACKAALAEISAKTEHFVTERDQREERKTSPVAEQLGLFKGAA